MKIIEILKDSEYKLELFSQKAIENLEEKIVIQEGKTAPNYYVACLVRDKQIKLTPEEIIRQLYLDKLINEYGYAKNKIQVEVAVQKGRDTGEKRGQKAHRYFSV